MYSSSRLQSAFSTGTVLQSMNSTLHSRLGHEVYITILAAALHRAWTQTSHIKQIQPPQCT